MNKIDKFNKNSSKEEIRVFKKNEYKLPHHIHSGYMSDILCYRFFSLENSEGDLISVICKDGIIILRAGINKELNIIYKEYFSN